MSSIPPLPVSVREFMSVLQTAGYSVYVVGGAVRDLLMGRPVTDWDFTTSATPDQILALFPDSFYHNTYGTVTIKWDKLQARHVATSSEPAHTENQSISLITAAPSVSQLAARSSQLLFEITPYRREGAYTDGRHPDTVTWAQTLSEDLARRDFTIGAMAYDGEALVDPYGGQADLRDRIVRAVGDPQARFREDALRMLRAIRFAAQLGCIIETQTYSAIRELAPSILQVSWERISDEFLKILSSPHPAEGVLFLRSSGLLRHILPELDACFAIEQKSPGRHHIYDVGTHLVQSLRHCRSTQPITRFATLIHDIGKVDTYRRDPHTGMITFYNHEVVGTTQARAIAERFRLSRDQTDLLVRLVEHHQFVVSEELTDNAIRRFIRNVGRDNLEEMYALRHADRMGGAAAETSWRTELFKKRVAELLIEPFTVKDLKIDGHDVMRELQLQPSRQIGDILDSLFERVIARELPNEREALLSALHTSITS